MTQTVPASKRLKDSSTACSPSEAKSPSTPQIRELDFTLFPIRLFVCLNQEEFDHVSATVAFISNPGLWLPGDAGASTHITDTPTGRVAVICIGWTDQPLDWLMEMITHESYHVLRSLEDAMKESEPGSEYPAYVIGRIARFTAMQLGLNKVKVTQ